MLSIAKHWARPKAGLAPPKLRLTELILLLFFIYKKKCMCLSRPFFFFFFLISVFVLRVRKPTSVFISRAITELTVIFIRNNGVKRSLQPPYSKPYKVLNINFKYMTLLISGRTNNVSIGRLKPAYQECPQTTSSPNFT